MTSRVAPLSPQNHSQNGFAPLFVSAIARETSAVKAQDFNLDALDVHTGVSEPLVPPALLGGPDSHEEQGLHQQGHRALREVSLLSATL
jgi:hypothetical protein